MCVVIDLDVVCLICLKPNKEMHSIFTKDSLCNSELQIAQKISILSELKINDNNTTLPTKICIKCLQDLKTAWRFHKNCQAAVTIFQTIVNLDSRIQPSTNVADKNLVPQETKVFKSLQIKRIANSENENMCKKYGEIKKAFDPVEKVLINSDNVDSTLYEELSPHDYIENTTDKHQEFHTVEMVESGDANDEVEEEEDDEQSFVEYYLTEDASADKSYKVERNITVKPKSVTHIEYKEVQSKLTEYLVKNNKPQPRDPVKKQVSQKEATKKSQTLPKRKFVDQIVVASSDECSKSVQPEVRQVKTRKCKSISSDTKSPKICHLCGNSYRYQHALNAHMRRHYNEKPFPCDFCDKAFVSNVELRRHMRVHTGQKPYACQYCDRRFSDFGSRIKHERTHTGERPYQCSTCGKSFAYPHVLSVHLLTHTGEKRFRCEYCSKGFTKKAYLLSHVVQHHNNVQDIDDSITDSNSQTHIESVKSVYTTEFVNEDDIPENEEYEGKVSQEHSKIAIGQSLLQPKMETETDEDEMHEIVEVEPEEYTITVQ